VAARFPGTVLCALGYDRDQAEVFGAGGAALDRAMEALREQAEAALGGGQGLAALGEMGLDFHYSPGTAEAQVALFRRQLALAGELRLPVIVHSREADDPTLAALRDFAPLFGAGGRGGVLHCFTGSRAFAEALAELGAHLSFSGIITFRNAAALRAVAAVVPGGKLLIETDTPYLAPEPHRGERNEPAYLPRVAEAAAAARKCAVEEIADLTALNAAMLFGCRPAVSGGGRGLRRADAPR
jgi:TatD DNase family protein